MSEPAVIDRPAAEAPVRRGDGAPGALAQDLGVIIALWRRDMLRLVKERSRWIGVVLQPLLFWVLIGSGMGSTFRLPGAEGMDYLTYFFPGILIMIVLFTTIFATISVIEDRQMGFLQGVLTAPGSRAAMVIGKVAGVTTMALIQAALFVVIAPFAGTSLADVAWLSLLAVLVLGCVGLTAMNFSVAWVLSSSQAYHAIMSVVLIPLWILSGAMFPPQGSWLGVIMTVNPMTYAVDGARVALAGGTSPVPGPGLGVDLAVLVGFSIAMLAIAVAVARRPGGAR